MIYLKYFESNNLYSEISYTEATEMSDRITDLSDRTVRTISKWGWKHQYEITDDHWPTFIGRKHKSTMISGGGWFVMEYDDNWYVIGVFIIKDKKRYMKYYKCDNIEGLKQVLSELEIIQ